MANILVLVSYKVFPAEMGGQNAVLNLYQYLSTHHNIHFVLSSDNGMPKDFRVERILFPHKKMLWNVFKIFQLKNICKKQKIQLIIAEHSYTGWIAYLVQKVTGIPFLIRSHNIETSRFRQMKRPFWKWYGLYEKWIHRKADYNFFITEEDKRIAISQFGLSLSKSDVVPYGIKRPKEIIDTRIKFSEKFGIHSPHIFYFNGTLDYLPNRVAIECLIDKLDPILQLKDLDYIIIISGKNLPANLANRINTCANIIYIGFIEEVNLLYQSASVFLNPVTNNSGIKTKVVEALANHCKVVSMRDGATGISPDLYGAQMVLAENGDWQGFAEKVITILQCPHSKTPQAFFDYFSAEKISEKAAGKINLLVHANS